MVELLLITMQVVKELGKRDTRRRASAAKAEKEAGGGEEEES